MRISVQASLVAAACWPGLVSSAAFPTTDAAAATTALQTLGVDTAKFPARRGDPTFTCKVLTFLFPKNETFTAASNLYTALVDEPWSQTCWLEPACIVTPKSAHEVSIIIQVISALETKFAIRSGGHKPTPGFNSVGGDGILIALQNLNSLKISADRNTVTVGTGARWRDAYIFAKKYDKILVGGRAPMVGVGGFLLGGGVNLFVNTWGLALDLVTRFQIVLPSGATINATPQNHPTLFKALKGGLSNYGIITEFDIPTLPLHPPNNNTTYNYRVTQYTPTQTPALLQAYTSYLASPATNTNTTVQIQCTSNSTAAFFGHISPYPTDPPDFHRFNNITIDTTLIPQGNADIVNTIILGIGAAATTLGNWVGLGFSHRVVTLTNNSSANTIMAECYTLFLNASKTLPGGMYLTYVPQGILPSVVDIGRSMNGGNLFGLERVPQVWVDLYMTYAHTSDTAEATRIVEELGREMQGVIDRAGAGLDFIFPSTAGEGQKVLRGYGMVGGGGREEVERVAGVYDKGGVMQRLQSGGYLLRDV